MRIQRHELAVPAAYQLKRLAMRRLAQFPRLDVLVSKERRSCRFLLDDIQLILAHIDAVNHVERHRRKSEPADESDEEAARRAPESSHVRVLLHTATQAEQGKLHRLVVLVHLSDPYVHTELLVTTAFSRF